MGAWELGQRAELNLKVILFYFNYILNFNFLKIVFDLWRAPSLFIYFKPITLNY